MERRDGTAPPGGLAVSVKVALPAALREHANGQAEIVLAGSGFASVAAALEALFALHPGLRDRVLTQTGELRQHVHLFVGAESIRSTGGFATAVPDGAEVTILPAVSGG